MKFIDSTGKVTKDPVGNTGITYFDLARKEASVKAKAYSEQITPYNPAPTPPTIAEQLRKAEANAYKRVTAYISGLFSSGFTTTEGITMDTTTDDVRLLDDGMDLANRNGETVMTLRDFNNTLHANIPLANVEVMIKELATNARSILGQKWMLEEQIKAIVANEALDDETKISTLNNILAS